LCAGIVDGRLAADERLPSAEGGLDLRLRRHRLDNIDAAIQKIRRALS
jgi:hypothetical protein